MPMKEIIYVCAYMSAGLLLTSLCDLALSTVKMTHFISSGFITSILIFGFLLVWRVLIF